MHWSSPSREWVPRNPWLTVPFPPRQARRMTLIAIARIGSQGVVLRSGQLARVLVERFDNIVVWLIGFPGGQLVQPWSDNLLFGDLWKALLSLHAAKLSPK